MSDVLAAIVNYAFEPDRVWRTCCFVLPMLTRKYPTERREHDDYGREVYSGWHWSEDERLQRLHSRLTRLLRRTL